jgi:NAD(P)H dehydrogenase (quinone)
MRVQQIPVFKHACSDNRHPAMSRVLVPFYSAYGHVYALAQAVAEGAEAAGAEVRLRRIPELPAAREAMSGQDAYVQAQEQMADVEELTHDDLRWADAIGWGTPTRYGNAAAQVRAFIDTTGGLWQSGALEGKAAGVFVSTATIHGGQETTVMTFIPTLLHLGMIIVGTPYGENPQILTTDGVGGSPYGPGTLAGPDGSRMPVDVELKTARNLGARLAKVGAAFASAGLSRK